MSEFHHVSVLLEECIQGLAIKPDGIYVDGTLGGAGHSSRIAAKLTTGRLIGIDRDNVALEAAAERLKPYEDRVTLVHANFCDMDEALEKLGIDKVDGILLDLGVSSPQLDDGQRGFSYMTDAPLDMRMNGEDVYKRTDEQLAVFRRREVGLVYQFYNLIPVLDVEENITLPVRMDGRKVNEQRLHALVSSLGLKGFEHHLPNQLSGGQQQRVAIGRALMNSPAIVLADEPTGNLDSKNSVEIMRLLRSSNRDLRQTLVVITHDEDVALMAPRVIAIEDGRVVSDERRG